MLRFISHIFKLHYEECKGCEILKGQLELKNQENQQLMEMLLNLVKPEIVQQPVVPVKPFIKAGANWGIVRKNLEEKDREEARIRREQEVLNKKLQNPVIEELEKELGVNDASQVGKTI